MLYLVLLSFAAVARHVTGQNATIVTLKSSVTNVKIGEPFTIMCEVNGSIEIPYRMELRYSSHRVKPALVSIAAFFIKQEGKQEFKAENGFWHYLNIKRGADQGFNFAVNASSEKAAGIYQCALYAVNKKTFYRKIIATSDQWAARYLKYISTHVPDAIPAVTVTKTMKKASNGNGDIAWQCTVDVKPQNHVYDFSVGYYVQKTILGMYKTKQDIRKIFWQTIKNEKELDDLNQINLYPTEMRTYPVFEVLMRQNLYDLDDLRNNSLCVVNVTVYTSLSAIFYSDDTQLVSSIGSLAN